MLMIRLQRVGRRNDPSFRIVIVDSRRSTKSGNFIEVVGSYDPRKGEPQIKAERVKYWLSVGAKTSGTVNNLLVNAKIISGAKVHVSPNVKKGAEAKVNAPEIKTEEKKEEVPAAA